MKILVVGVGDPIPTFIRRRIAALAGSGIQVVVALGYHRQNTLPPTVEIVRFGDFLQMGGWGFIGFMSKVLAKPRIFYLVFKALQHQGFRTRLKLTVRYFPLCLPRGVDIIHLQWLAQVSDLHWLKTFHQARLVASVRGSQVTIYPVTRTGYYQIIQNALQLADAYQLVSSDLRAPCLALGAVEDKLFVNYNGIDLDQFTPARKQKPGNTLRLISVGALMWRKAYFFQLLVVRQLIGSGSQITLTIVGAGPDREGLMHTARIFGIQDAVFFTGQLVEAEIIGKLQEADVYISTSLAEGLPNSLVEAAACGLPIVAFECEGVREIVEHGGTGYVVPAGDTNAMAGYVKQLQEEIGRMEMGKRARVRIERYFNQDECVKEVIGYYGKILNGSW